MSIKEKSRQFRLDRALDKINRQCAVLDVTHWSDMAVQIRGHIAYIQDSESALRRERMYADRGERGVGN